MLKLSKTSCFKFDAFQKRNVHFFLKNEVLRSESVKKSNKDNKEIEESNKNNEEIEEPNNDNEEIILWL